MPLGITHVKHSRRKVRAEGAIQAKFAEGHFWNRREVVDIGTCKATLPERATPLQKESAPLAKGRFKGP
jgi:hypothetical protein